MFAGEVFMSFIFLTTANVAIILAEYEDGVVKKLANVDC